MRYTGLGSLPGTDLGAAVRMTFERVPDLPYLPELPARGPHAQLVGRGLGVLAGLEADLVVGQWRLGAGGIDQRRARATLRDDLDLLEENSQGYSGTFKVSVAGPWTLAASTALARGGGVLDDDGACRDLAASLAEGVGELLEAVLRRVPGAELVLQVDEPSLPAVLAGAVPTSGGFFRHRAVELPTAVAALAMVTAEPARRGLEATTVVHCCAPGLPVAELLRHGRDGAGFDAVSLDQDLIRPAQLDDLTAALDQGSEVWLGCLATTSGEVGSVDDLRRRVLGFVDQVGLPERLARQLVLTPACGLAGFSASSASRAFGVLRRVAEQVDAELAG